MVKFLRLIGDDDMVCLINTEHIMVLVIGDMGEEPPHRPSVAVQLVDAAPAAFYLNPSTVTQTAAQAMERVGRFLAELEA